MGRAIPAPSRTRDNGGVSEPSTSPSRPGYTRSLGGMAGALIAVTGLMVGVWALTWFQRGDLDDPARTVEYSAVLAAARQQAPFHVVAPDPVPPGLRATSVSWEGGGGRVAWHLGFVTTDRAYIGLYQGNGPADDFVAANTPAAGTGQVATITQVRWRILSDADQRETALVRTSAGVTTVVTGTATLAQLTTFAGSLR